MTHLHIPDGIIPMPWLVLSFLLSSVLLAMAIYQTRTEDLPRKVPRIGVLSALMLLTMSIPLGIIPYHLNLTVLAGIILGPWLGFIAVFLVNLILGLVGHGGITVVGLNSLIIGSEVFWGYYLFRKLKFYLQAPLAAGTATLITLFISSFLMIGVVGLTQINPGELLHHHGHEQALLSGEQHEEHGALQEDENHEPAISLNKFAALVLPLALLGAVIEALVISLIVGYFLRVKPDIIETEYLEKSH